MIYALQPMQQAST